MVKSRKINVTVLKCIQGGAAMQAGVYQAKKKDGTIYYRSSITFSGKHISLGSYGTEDAAHKAYLLADHILHDTSFTLLTYTEQKDIPLSFSKWVVLLNFRDNQIYIKTPIYLYKTYFYYYFGPEDFLIFDSDDLFYYSTRTISRRGGHLFVSDYGMQVNILSRYGIKNYAVAGRDYQFANGNNSDYRYENIIVINRFHGVFHKNKNGKSFYETRIHYKGEWIVGRYQNEIEAAIAYNKAASTLIKKGYIRDYPVNYIEELTDTEYHSLYMSVPISKKLLALTSLL